MGEEELYQAIFKRKSVRNYEGGPLDAGTMSGIEAFLKTLRSMDPDIRTEIRIIENSKVRGLFKVDAPHFLAFFSEVKEGHLTNAGFMLQQVDLFLSSTGIGSCWQGGPKPVKGVVGPSGLEFTIAMAFGRPAEGLQRRSVSEFKREPMAKITSMQRTDAYLEAARLAPSAMNNQPWYFLRNDGTIDAFSSRSFLLDKMNHISLGIALCHVWLAAQHEGKKVEFVIGKKADMKTPKGYSYVSSLSIH
jgi:nitroreductase